MERLVLAGVWIVGLLLILVSYLTEDAIDPGPDAAILALMLVSTVAIGWHARTVAR